MNVNFFLKKPRGVARSEAEAKRFAEEDAIATKAREARIAALAATAAMRNDITNGTTPEFHKHRSDSPVSCAPTLPESAIMTPSARGPRQEGQRNLQDSTFSISGQFSKLFIDLFVIIQIIRIYLLRKIKNICKIFLQLK